MSGFTMRVGSVGLVVGILSALAACRQPAAPAAPPSPPTKEQVAGLRTQIPGRDLARDPPIVQELTVQPLQTPSAAGNALLRVRFAEDERLPNKLSFHADDAIVTLADDGTGGDESAGDRVFSATTTLDLDSLRASQQRLAASRTAQPVDVFKDRRKVPRELKLDPALIRPGGRFTFTPVGDPANIDVSRSLAITDPAVVQDPTRTRTACGGTSMGKWSFGYLMEQMANTPATGVTASDFTLRWLQRWEFDQVANDWLVARRTQIRSQIIDPWIAASGGPGSPLDLSKAPFRLLAIVNRVDLRSQVVYGGGNAGEARFVFGALGPACQVLQFTVIFEYGVPKSGCTNVKAWAQLWKNLDTHPLGSPAYNTALEVITEQFVTANADPSKPNGSALNQLRTNEIALAGPWELREFNVSGATHHLELVTTKQTPDLTLKPSNALGTYVNGNVTDIKNDRHKVPLQFPVGSRFLSGSSLTPGGFFWDNAAAPGPVIADREARHKFSLNTCNGCHAGETATGFTHVKPAAFGGAVALSAFMTGGNVPDPADAGVPVRTFNDLERRATDLDALLATPCKLIFGLRPLMMVH